MEETKLQYRGKKAPFKTPPIIKQSFVFGEDPVWVPSGVAETLMQINPAMFYKLGERDTENPVEDASSIKPKEELEIEYECEVCGKKYKSEPFFLRHIEGCTNDERRDQRDDQTDDAQPEVE